MTRALRPLLSSLLLGATLLHGAGCGPADDAPAKVAAHAAALIDPANPPDPPLVQIATAGTPNSSGDVPARLFLTYSRADRDRIGPTFTLHIDPTRRLTVRDDGVAPDLRADDAIFTGAFTANTISMRQYSDLLARQAALGPAPTFQGRALGPRVTQPLFDLTGFLAGRVVTLPHIFGFPGGISKGASLLVTHTSVVNDRLRTNNDPCNNTGNPNGPWTFGAQMKKLAAAAGNPDPAAFTLAWLNQWKTNQTINGWTVSARPAVQTMFIDPWPKVAGKLDLGRAPFRLLAIVNRVDLGTTPGYGVVGSAGEGRMVYGALDPKTCKPLPFTVIFEYGIQRTTCPSIRSWGKAWKDLAALGLGTPAYKAALQALTDQFTVLNQLRTNENAMNPTWRLDEFKINGKDLVRVVVAQTPDTSLNQTSTLATFINTTDSDENVPLTFLGAKFQGGASTVPSSAFFWDARGVLDQEDRRLFSLRTCNGCHAGETKTPFTHISATHPLGQQATLSGFLTGITVTSPPPGATYNDLEERAKKLDALINDDCSDLIKFPLPNILTKPPLFPH